MDKLNKRISGLDEPVLAFRYTVNIFNKEDSGGVGFSEISGLSSELEVEPLFAGGENNLAYYLPKQVKYTPLVLKRGFFSMESALTEWIKSVLYEGFEKKVDTENIVIQLEDDEKKPIIKWTLFNAYPTKWEVSGFNAMENKVVVESITFHYTNFKLEFI